MNHQRALKHAVSSPTPHKYLLAEIPINSKTPPLGVNMSTSIYIPP